MFSPVMGKRSRGLYRNSSSLRDFGRAGDLGFEPRLLDPESSVLPLHQSPRDMEAHGHNLVRLWYVFREFPARSSLSRRDRDLLRSRPESEGCPPVTRADHQEDSAGWIVEL